MQTKIDTIRELNQTNLEQKPELPELKVKALRSHVRTSVRGGTGACPRPQE